MFKCEFLCSKLYNTIKNAIKIFFYIVQNIQKHKNCDFDKVVNTEKEL